MRCNTLYTCRLANTHTHDFHQETKPKLVLFLHLSNRTHISLSSKAFVSFSVIFVHVPIRPLSPPANDLSKYDANNASPNLHKPSEGKSERRGSEAHGTWEQINSQRWTQKVALAPFWTPPIICEMQRLAVYASISRFFFSPPAVVRASRVSR